jgi:hypothetical protein
MQTAPAVGGSGLTTTANGVSSPTGGISTSTGGSSATLTGTVNGVLTTMVMPTSSSPSSILSQSNAGTQSGMRGGAIAGIVVGSIVAVIVLLAAILFGYRRIRRDRRAEMDVGDGKPELPYQNKIYEASSKEATKHSVLQGRGELFEAPDNTMRHELPEGIAGDGRHERNDFSHS